MSIQLMAGDVVTVVSGNVARGVRKGMKLTVVSVESLGADYSHQVKVVLRRAGANFTQGWYVRHINRTREQTVALNDGNPLHRIVVLQRLDK